MANFIMHVFGDSRPSTHVLHDAVTGKVLESLCLFSCRLMLQSKVLESLAQESLNYT